MSYVKDVTVDRRVNTPHGELQLVIWTEHSDGSRVVTARHKYTRPHSIGGFRFVANGNTWSKQGQLDEVASLAVAMTDKAAAASIPTDGQKSVANCPKSNLQDNDYKAAVLRAHIAAAIERDPTLIFGPDMCNNEDCLSTVVKGSPLYLRYVTGLTRLLGGLEIDKTGLTATGLATAVDALKTKFHNVSIQGFGAVGSNLARQLYAKKHRIAAVSNERGVAVANCDGGLDVHRLCAIQEGIKDADDCLRLLEREGGCEFYEDRARFFEIKTDLFVPAARTSVLGLEEELADLRHENNEVRSVEEYLSRSGVSCVLEGANHPVSFGGEKWLEANGVTILPDYIVNCGGMIGCFVEWAFRAELMDSDEAHERFEKAVTRYVRDRILTNVTQLLLEGGAVRDAAARIVTTNRRLIDEKLEHDHRYPGPADARRLLEGLRFEMPGA